MIRAFKNSRAWKCRNHSELIDIWAVTWVRSVEPSRRTCRKQLHCCRHCGLQSLIPQQMHMSAASVYEAGSCGVSVRGAGRIVAVVYSNRSRSVFKVPLVCPAAETSRLRIADVSRESGQRAQHEKYWLWAQRI